jgi:restriction system protein
MAIPSYEDLMPLVLEYSTEERSVRESVPYFSDLLKLTDEERDQTIPSGTKPLIRSRIEWAITYLVQAGLLERPRRGRYKITAHGLEVLAKDKDQLDLAYLKRIPAFIDFFHRSSDTTTVDKNEAPYRGGQKDREVSVNRLDPEERIGEAYAEIEADLKSQIITRILQNSPAFFEEAVVELLSAMGYGGSGLLTKAIGKPGDGGIDGIIHQDKLGLDVVYIQAKRYAPENKVQRSELQAFIGTLVGESAHKGVFVTTSDFTQGAKDYLRTVNVRVITISGSQLVDLMIEHGIGVKVKQRIDVHRIDEDFFIEE